MTASLLHPASRRTYRVIHTEWSDGWGGQEHRIITEMAGMQARGHQILLATRATAKIAGAARAAGIQVVELPFRSKTDWQTIRPLRDLIRDEGYEIVHTHSSLDTWVGALAARLGGARFVRTRHLNLPMRHRWYNVHGHYDRLITCGEVMRSLLCRDFGFRPEGIVSIPTGIDFGRFVPGAGREAMRQALGMGSAHFMILMVGVVRGVKRYDVALRAFARLRPECPQIRLVVAGTGPMLGDMQALAANLGIDDAVQWLGHRQDVPALMAAADAALLTSRSEGVPQAMTQALSMALPCVATAVGGVPEIVHDRETGLLAPSEGEAEIAAALLEIIRNPEWARQLGQRGSVFVRQHLSIDNMLDKTEQVYHELGLPAATA